MASDTDKSKDNTKLIEAPELNFTKASGIVAVVAAVVSAIIPAIKDLQGNVSAELMQASVMLVGVCVMAFVFSAAVDVLARAWVTAADLRRKATAGRGEHARDAVKASPTGAGGAQPAALPAADPAATAAATVAAKRAALATAGVAFNLRVDSLASHALPVLAVRWDPESEETYYLVGGPGARPRWVKDAEATGLSYPVPEPAKNGV